jgi:hypothetical protein
MKERVWVVCGNMREFDIYVRNKPLNGDKKYSYVDRADTLRGIRNPHGVLVGNWKHRDDIIQILEQLIITSENPSNLQDIKRDLIRSASAAVTHSAAVSNAAKLLADAIDQQVLDSIAGIKSEWRTPDYEDTLSYKTWQGFVK